MVDEDVVERARKLGGEIAAASAALEAVWELLPAEVRKEIRTGFVAGLKRFADAWPDFSDE